MTKLAAMRCACIMIAALAAPVRAEGPDAGTVVATVNGTPITLGQMAVTRDALPDDYKQLPDEVLFKGILDQLIQQTLVAAKAEAEMTPRVELELANRRMNYLSGTYLDRIAEEALTEEALNALFTEKYGDAPAAKEYSAAHILVPTREEAVAVRERLDAGEDFATIARELSQDPGSAQNGGDLGWFGLGMMVEPFEKAVVAMQAGQVSEPVETQFGWHVIRLNEVRDRPVTLDEKRDELAGEIQRAAIEAEIRSLTEGATITRSEEGIDPAILADPSIFGE